MKSFDFCRTIHVESAKYISKKFISYNMSEHKGAPLSLLILYQVNFLDMYFTYFGPEHFVDFDYFPVSFKFDFSDHSF